MEQFADHRFTGLLEAVPDAMVCVDGDGRIAVVNAQAEQMFGYARGELIGQPVEILVPDQARKVHQLHRAGYIADPQSRPMGTGMELAARRRDGSTFPAEISLSAVETGDGIVVAAAVRDVTLPARSVSPDAIGSITADLGSLVMSSVVMPGQCCCARCWSPLRR